MLKITLLICSILIALSLNAQESRPYFQQEVNYTINVSLNDVAHELHGDISLEYINNSPDQLDFIWFHLWPNAYKNNHTPLAKQLIADGNTEFSFADDSQRGWIDGIDFKVNGEKVKTEPGSSIDIVKVILNKPIPPGGRVTISTPFMTKIPIGVFSRLGHIGQQYQITQWFPKPAVYDHKGWHPIPYLNQGEFYSEFGSFDVSITLPDNYVVGATGTLENGEKEQERLMQIAQETKNITQYNRRDTAFPASSASMKTLRYKAENIHDFAWFADKRYHVLHDVVELPHSGKKVDCWVMFTNMEGELWKDAVEYVKQSVYYYSKWNGDYPYPHATAVDGALSAGGGMEYPMITVIGSSGNAETLDRVIAHEVGHNWFYGILGSNERDHAWMDEGINSFNENRYMAVRYPKDSASREMNISIAGMRINPGKLLGIPDLDESTLFDLGYQFNAARKLDQPVQCHAAEYTSINYGTIVYGRTAVLFKYLQAYLGEEVFDKCAQAYFEKWKFKHPYPEDIRKVYEEVSGKDLGFLFDRLINSTDQFDVKILSAKRTAEGNYKIRIKNSGRVKAPGVVALARKKDVVAEMWFEGFEGISELEIPGSNIPAEFTPDKVVIDPLKVTPDFKRQNNTSKISGLCKKTEPFNPHLYGVVRNTDKTQIFFAPIVAWNNYNQFMAGAAIYNNMLPERRFEYVLMPLYSFRNNDLAGGATLSYNLHFNKVFQSVRLGVNAERYAWSNTPLDKLNYNKAAPFLVFDLKKKHLNSSVNHQIGLRSVNVWREFAQGNYSFSPPIYDYDTVTSMINEIVYTLDNKRKIHPRSFNLGLQQIKEDVKISFEVRQRVQMKNESKRFDVRVFAGWISDTTNDGNHNIYASGGDGIHDYMYDNVFLGRSESSGFLSHQFIETEGAMKTYTPLGRSDSWLASLNIKGPMPGKIPFKFFTDVVFLPNGLYGKQKQLFDAGIYFSLIPNIVDVYVPLFMSKEIRDVFYLNNADLVAAPGAKDPDKYRFKRTWRLVRFTFNIHKLNPFEVVKKLSL